MQMNIRVELKPKQRPKLTEEIASALHTIPCYQKAPIKKEYINTMEAKGEVLITIMASLAQQESQSLSQNVKLGLQFIYQQGMVQVNHNRFLGYTKDEK